MNKIAELQEQRNAVILARDCQRDQGQEIADFSGDSLGLSRAAAGTDADVVVFYPASEQAVCPNMKKTTLEKTLWSMGKMHYEVRGSLKIFA